MASQLSVRERILNGQSADPSPAPRPEPRTDQGHLEIRGLSKSFGDRTVLRGLNLDIRHGEFVAVIGRSGCGKSTLMRLLAGLEAPTQGRIAVNGTALQGLNARARVMFQDARLLPWERVLKNVRLGLPDSAGREPAEAALRDVGLADRADDWPHVLSGGQRQRVALARALACRPEILLLDEPLGSLDALTRLEMQRLILRLWEQEQWTILLVTHDVEEAISLADRIILIEEGQIALNLPVTLPRPRHRAGAAYTDLAEELLNCLHGGDYIYGSGI